jgi:hypothetical protein
MHVIIFMSLTFWGLIVDPSWMVCVFYIHRAVHNLDRRFDPSWTVCIFYIHRTVHNLDRRFDPSWTVCVFYIHRAVHNLDRRFTILLCSDFRLRQEATALM